MDYLRQAVPSANTPELMDRGARTAPAAPPAQENTPHAVALTAQESTPRAVAPPDAVRPAGPPPAAHADTQGRGVPLVDALVTLSSGNSMVTDMVFGSDNQISQVRVLDAATHQLIASCPPETIARAQQEMIAYQAVAQTRKPI